MRISRWAWLAHIERVHSLAMRLLCKTVLVVFVVSISVENIALFYVMSPRSSDAGFSSGRLSYSTEENLRTTAATSADHLAVNESIYAGYSLTGRPGPDIQLLKEQLTQCSRGIGLSETTLTSSIVNTVARNLSIFLNALQSIIPQNFSHTHKNPCWYSQLSLTEHINLLRAFFEPETPDQNLSSCLHKHIFEPALNSTKKKLLCLPAFFLAGFPKSGTTTLYKALLKHPMVADPERKEPHWWTRIPLNITDQDYLRLAFTRYLVFFYGRVNFRYNAPEVIIPDASQSTLWDSNFVVETHDYCAMPVAIHHILPRAKFIVMMRNPVERTYSHCQYSIRRKDSEQFMEPEYFHQVVQNHVSAFNQCRSLNRSDLECANFHKSPSMGVGYRLFISLYYVHLLKWLQFFPKDQFLFLRTEDISQNICNEVITFLDLKPHDETCKLLQEKQNEQKKYPAMLPQTRKLLSEFFQPFNKKLVELTGDSRFLWEDY